MKHKQVLRNPYGIEYPQREEIYKNSSESSLLLLLFI